MAGLLGRSSGKNLVDRLPAVRNRERPTTAIINRHVGVDAEAVVDGGADVTNPHRMVFHVLRAGVRCAVNRAAANACAGKDDGVTEGPVIAAAVLVDLR